MNVSNHLVAGAVIALSVKQPLLAVPLAFVSHFALDALPHYGFERQGFQVWMKEKSAGLMVVFDSICTVLLLFTLIYFEQYFALFAAFVALSPDCIWIYRYFKFERNHLMPAYNKFNRFHLAIQWCERKWGIFVEMALFISLFAYLQMILINS